MVRRINYIERQVKDKVLTGTVMEADITLTEHSVILTVLQAIIALYLFNNT